MSDIYLEYYAVADDREEMNNLYNMRKFKKNVRQLRKRMMDYLTNRRNLALNKTPAVYDEKQLEILKALGYIR